MKLIKIPILLLISVLLSGCSDVSNLFDSLLTIWAISLKWFIIIGIVIIIISIIGGLFSKK